MPAGVDNVTGLLAAWTAGDCTALDQLLPLVYGELLRLARLQLSRERQCHTLETSALVHETYLRLVGVRSVRWQGRAHFLALAAQTMRRILVDYARTRGRDKRGGGAEIVPLDASLIAADGQSYDTKELEEALLALTRVDARKAQVVEMRFFGGMSVEEVADVLRVSPDTVVRDWKLAKVWLLRALQGPHRHVS